MWIEQKGDTTILCQGMGKNAFIFYHRFWGIVAVASCPRPEEVQKEGKLTFNVRKSIQISTSKIERLIKESWGNNWGDYVFNYDYVNNDNVGDFASRLDIREIK